MYTIKAVVPAGATGIVNVSVITRAGASESSFDDTWVFVHTEEPMHDLGRPAVWGVAPSSGSPGDTVKVLGTGFEALRAVEFGGVPADISGIDPNDPTIIDLELPVPAGRRTRCRGPKAIAAAIDARGATASCFARNGAVSNVMPRRLRWTSTRRPPARERPPSQC